MLEETLDLREREIVDFVSKLQAQGIIRLEDPYIESCDLAAYAIHRVFWYWLTIVIGAITTTLVFIVPANLFPWIYVRNFFGVIFVLFLPGYAFVKALFPTNLPGKISSESIETIERVALSVGLSIALVSMVGLLLYYSPFGLDLDAIVLSLFAFTSVLATAAVIRGYHASKQS
jgi:uncharacterized membrane protein